MDQLRELAVKVYQVLNALQCIHLPATPENMRNMLASQNRLEEIKNELIRLSTIRKEASSDDSDRSEVDYPTDCNHE